ncbi:MAG: peptide chain release factor N(5)-glutamine methyltransferase, partial [bacterium]|nr:peptide chain release factor N(5)-glutamine methyltransferase [bacterium]
RTFKVDSRALIPRPETELLIEYILASELPPKPMILDVGTGSGIIGISLALEFPNSTVVGTDISLMAIELAEKNRKLLNASNYSACNCYLAEGIKAEFDLIAANLPYIPSGEILSLDSEVRDYDPVSALDGGTEGTLLILELVKSAPDLLTSGGLIVLETGYDQASSVPAMFSGGCWANVQTHKDLAGNHRMVTARRR